MSFMTNSIERLSATFLRYVIDACSCVFSLLGNMILYCPVARINQRLCTVPIILKKLDFRGAQGPFRRRIAESLRKLCR
jgi:hypothetical protein